MAAPSRARVISPLKTKPIRAIIKWQIIATAAVAAVAGSWVGWQGAISAVLGGVVTLSAGVVYAVVLGLGLDRTQPTAAGASLVAMFRAEALKILVIVVQLWLVLTIYKELVPAAFFAAFVLTVLAFRAAFLVRPEDRADDGRR